MSQDRNVNNDSGANERRIRDMLGLVKFCLESTASEDASGSNELVEPMDADRLAWLQNAFASMTVDTTKQLLENLTTVKETVVELIKYPNAPVRVNQTCQSMEILTDLCEEIDYARDFAKLDGYSIFIPLINCRHEQLIIKACELIAALSQNNPVCQDIALEIRLLEKLIDFVDFRNTQNFIKARSYALYAISSIIRSNPRVRNQFERQLDGLSVLMKLLDFNSFEDPSCEVVSSTTTTSTTSSTLSSSSSDNRSQQAVSSSEITSSTATPASSSSSSNQLSANPNEAPTDQSKLTYWLRKLRIRAIFLFRTLCSESSNASNYFYEKQAIKLLAKQLQQPQDRELREHLLQAVYAFLSSLDQTKRVASMVVVPNLSEVVANIRRRTSVSEAVKGGDHYDLTDTRSICEELLQLIDSIQHPNNNHNQQQNQNNDTPAYQHRLRLQ